MTLLGMHLLGDARSRSSGEAWQARAAASGELIEPGEPGWIDATPDEVERALNLAHAAHRQGSAPDRRADLLDAIGDAWRDWESGEESDARYTFAAIGRLALAGLACDAPATKEPG